VADQRSYERDECNPNIVEWSLLGVIQNNRDIIHSFIYSFIDTHMAAEKKYKKTHNKNST